MGAPPSTRGGPKGENRFMQLNKRNIFSANLIIIYYQNGNYPIVIVFLLLWVYPVIWEGGMGQEVQLESAQVKFQIPAKTKAKRKQKCPKLNNQTDFY